MNNLLNVKKQQCCHITHSCQTHFAQNSTEATFKTILNTYIRISNKTGGMPLFKHRIPLNT